jgi:hypothetical protein
VPGFAAKDQSAPLAMLLHMSGDHVRTSKCVAIQKYQNFVVGNCRTRVRCHGAAGRRVMVDHHEVQLTSHFFQNLARVIGGPVIYDNDLGAFALASQGHQCKPETIRFVL